MDLFKLFGRVYMEEAGGDGGDGGGAPAKPATTAVDTKEPDAPKVPEAEKPGDVEVLDKAGFAATDDPGLTYALTFLAKNGFTADNPAVDAAMGGDFSLLKAELAAKGLQGWEQALALGEQAYGRATEKQKQAQEAVGKVVVEIAEQSGVDWEEAVAHVGGSASNEVKTALNGLLADPATAAIAASFITNSFLQTGQSERDPTPAVRDTNTGAAPANAGGTLSRAEFTAEMRKLREKFGDNYLSRPEAQALYKRLA